MKAPGDRIGRFRIERLLGEGGVAQVYRVRHELLDTVHALKLLPVARRGLAKRLVQEGRIQAHLRHPNVVAVTDLVEEKGQIGLVMEFIEGYSLEECLREGGAMATDEAMDLYSQILSGVAAAHQAGVLHRDLKPANVLLTASEERVVAKVSDFGIAKLGSGPAEVRGNTRPIGTPGYMAPEQITSPDSADARSDVFALGAILYEMLSGRRTFAGRTAKEVMANTAAGRFTPLSEVVRGAPEAIDRAIRVALRVDPDARYQTVMDLARALGVEDAIVPLKTIPPAVEDGLAPPDVGVGFAPQDDQAAMPTMVHQGRGFDEASPTITEASDLFQADLDPRDDGPDDEDEDDFAAHPTLTPDEVSSDHPAFNTASDLLDDPPIARAPKRTPKIGWGRDEAVDTWAPEDTDAGFSLPAAAEIPKAALPPPPPARRAQAWSPPSAAEATLPLNAPPPTPAPSGRDLSSAIAQSLAANAEEPPEPAPPPPPPEDHGGGGGVRGLLQTALIAAMPLLGLALLAMLVSAWGSRTLGTLQEQALKQEAQLVSRMNEQPGLVTTLETLVAGIEDGEEPARRPDTELTRRRLDVWAQAGSPEARRSASKGLVEFMLIQVSELPRSYEDTTLRDSRHNLEQALRDLQAQHQAYEASVTAWREQADTPVGNVTLIMRMAEPPPEAP